jgi:hypothetical protein
MTKIQESSHRISVKVAEPQLKFLENRAKELGLSSTAELLRWFIIREMDKLSISEKIEQKESGFSTARSLLKFAGTWAGGKEDAEKVIQFINDTKTDAEF